MPRPAVRATVTAAADALRERVEQSGRERAEAAPARDPDGGAWVPGDAPSPAARRAVRTAARAGTIGTVGLYPPQGSTAPFGEAFMKNPTPKSGNCRRRRYLPDPVSMVAAGHLAPTPLVTRRIGAQDAIDAYRAFDRREAGWTEAALGVAGDRW